MSLSKEADYDPQSAAIYSVAASIENIDSGVSRQSP